MQTEDAIGHIGYAFLALGQASIAADRKIGWLLRMVGESIWIGIGIYSGWTSIWFWGSLFLIIESIGYWRHYSRYRYS